MENEISNPSCGFYLVVENGLFSQAGEIEEGFWFDRKLDLRSKSF